MKDEDIAHYSINRIRCCEVARKRLYTCHGANLESKEGGLMKGCQKSESVTVNPLSCTGLKSFL